MFGGGESSPPSAMDSQLPVVEVLLAEWGGVVYPQHLLLQVTTRMGAWGELTSTELWITRNARAISLTATS